MASYAVVRYQDNINIETERVPREDKTAALRAWSDMRQAHPYARVIYLRRHTWSTAANRAKEVTLHDYTVSSFAPDEVGRTAGERRAEAIATFEKGRSN